MHEAWRRAGNAYYGIWAHLQQFMHGSRGCIDHGSSVRCLRRVIQRGCNLHTQSADPPDKTMKQKQPSWLCQLRAVLSMLSCLCS